VQEDSRETVGMANADDNHCGKALGPSRMTWLLTRGRRSVVSSRASTGLAATERVNRSSAVVGRRPPQCSWDLIGFALQVLSSTP